MNRSGAEEAGARAQTATKVLDYLAAHHVMTLATAEPWAAAVFYVNEGFTLYFLSSPKSRHALHHARDPRAAATVQEDYRDWRAIKGVQLEGTVRRVPDAAVQAVRALYVAKFPVLGERGAAVAPLLQALARIAWYCVEPRRICFVDNSVRFGHRDCIDLEC